MRSFRRWPQEERLSIPSSWVSPSVMAACARCSSRAATVRRPGQRRRWQHLPTPSKSYCLQGIRPIHGFFLGSNAVAGVAAYVVPHFGAAATPLLTSPGRVALAAGYDAGDDRVFVATRTAVVALNTDAPTAHPVPLLTTLAAGAVASLATPALASGDAVLVLAPPGSTSATVPAGPSRAPTLFACRGAACLPRSIARTGASQIAAAGGDVVVWSGSSLAVSQDGGRSFAAAPAPRESSAPPP
jgi:hypothetical protein